jgi:tRNA threonylcarbamoyladenosine biosynthesis protein TsaB
MEGAMRIVAIETSGRMGSIAALYGECDGCRHVAQIVASGSERTAQALAPALRQLLTEANWPPASVGLVAVAVGPGSFTGLRIGVTTAKSYAYATGADIVGVNTLEALAVQAPPSSAPLWAVIDAQRQELFVAKFELDNASASRMVRESCILSQAAWVAELRSGDRVIGPALGRLAERLPKCVESVPPELWQPMAAAVGHVAWKAYQAGRRDNVWTLGPNYYRASAAEEKNPP